MLFDLFMPDVMLRCMQEVCISALEQWEHDRGHGHMGSDAENRILQRVPWSGAPRGSGCKHGPQCSQPVEMTPLIAQSAFPFVLHSGEGNMSSGRDQACCFDAPVHPSPAYNGLFLKSLYN